MADYWKDRLDEMTQITPKTSSSKLSSSNYWKTKLKELEEEEKQKAVAPVKSAPKKEEEDKPLLVKAYEKVGDFLDDSADVVGKILTGDIFKKEDKDIAPTVSTVTKDDEEDGKFTLKNAASWAGDVAMSGLASFNKGITSTADVLLGKPLESLGWENNPISKMADYYDDQYTAWRNEKAESEAKLGGGKVLSVVGELGEGAVAAVPNALAMLMSAGASLGATTTSTGLQQAALYDSGNLLTKIGMKVTDMVKNPQYWTSFAQTMGNEYEEAKAMGASDTVALYGSTISSLLNAGVEIGIDGMSGIQGLPAKVMSGNKGAFFEWVESSLSEGGEEMVQGVISNIVAKVAYDPETKVFDAKEMGKEFAMGTAVGGLLGGGQIAAVKGADAVSNAIQTHEDNKLTENEQKVVDKEVEDRIAAEEKDGEKLTNGEKKKIHEEVVNDLKRGYISTDTIEAVLGGETYTEYKNTTDNENALREEFETLGAMKKSDFTAKQEDRYNELKQKLAEIDSGDARNQLKTKLSGEVMSLAEGSRLAESYNERARRGEKFDADLTVYDEKQRAVVQKAIDSGILNNTNRTHEFVDMVAKISADKGVLFDFTNNEKLKGSGFALDGKTVNGFVNKDGVTVNIDSQKSLNSVVGHEITHVLKETGLYNKLHKAVVKYAKTKGDYQGRYDSLAALYKGVKGAVIDEELTADLVGDYLFTDADFVNNLSVQNRNVFQKIYDEVKYLVKVATAGSKEARELAKVKRAFDKAYQSGGKVTDTKYSLTPEQQEYFKDSKVRDENGDLKVMYHGTPNGDFTVFKDGTYFTENKQYADLYQNPGASSIKSGKVVTNPKTFEVYLDIKKPFDISDAEAKNIYINDYIKGGNAVGINPYLSDAEYDKINTVDWTEGEDLREFLIDNGYDYDGLVLDEGATGGYGEEVKQRGKSYVVFSPEQVKNIDNGKPTDSADIRYSLSEYTAEEKKAHNDAVLNHFGKTYKWAETGYLLLDGTRLDLSGKHDGAPGGYRTVDHRDITEALGYDYGGGDYSGSLIQFMSEGNIRIIPECNGINLSVKPTKEQERALSDFISRYRGEVMLDIDDLKGNTVVSVEYPHGTYYTRVLNDIREWFDNGKKPENSGSYSLTKQGETAKKHGRYHIKGEDVALDVAPVQDSAPVEASTSAPIRLYRGYNRSENAKEKNLTPKRTVYDVIGKSDKSGTIDLLPLAYYTEDATDAQAYADMDKNNLEMYRQLAKQTYRQRIMDGKDFGGLSEQDFAEREALETFRTLHGSDPNENGHVDEFDYLPGKVLDLTDLGGGETDVYSVHLALANKLGISQNDLDQVLRLGNDFELEMYPYQLLRNTPHSNLGTRFVDLVRGLGYDSIRYREGDYNHYAVIDGADGSNGRVRKVNKEEGQKRGKLAWYNRWGEKVSDVTKEDLTAQKADMEQRAAEMFARGEYDSNAFRQLEAEYNAVSAQLVEMQEDIAPATETDAQQNAGLDGLTDEGAPPEVETPYVSQSEPIALDDNTLQRLSQDIADTMSLDEDSRAEMDEIIRYYAQNEGVTEDELAEVIRRNFRFTEEIELGDDEISLAKQHMRGTRLYIPADFKSDFHGKRADGYNAFRKEHFGHFHLTTRAGSGALSVGELYGELSEYFPDLFPDSIINEADQLAKMAEIASTDTATDTRVMPYTEDTVQEVVGMIRDGISGYNQSAQMDAANAMQSEIAEQYSNTPIEEDIASVYENADGQQTMFPAEDDTAPVKEAPKIARVLVGEPDAKPKGFKAKVRAAFEKARNTVRDIGAMVDKGAAIENLSIETGNRQLQADYDYMYRTSAIAQRHIGKKLIPIRDAILKAEKAAGIDSEKKPKAAEEYRAQLFNYVYHLHNIDRMSLDKPENIVKRAELRKNFDGMSDEAIKAYAKKVITRNTPKDEVERIFKAQAYVETLETHNKAVFGDEVTAEVSREMVKQMETAHPEFKDIEQSIVEYNKELREMLVAGGLISRKTAELWEKIYPHYVPIRRIDREGANIFVPLDTNRTGVNAPVKRATGGNGDIGDLLNTMAARTEQTYRALARNKFGVELKNTLRSKAETEAAQATKEIYPDGIIPAGTRVRAHDRENVGEVRSYDAKTNTYTVYFENKQGQNATVQLDASILSPIKQTSEQLSMEELLDEIDEANGDLLKAGKRGVNPTFTVFENGERVEFDINEDIYNALKPVDGVLAKRYKMPSKAVGGFKKLVTEWSIRFMFSNPIKDAQDILWNSQHAAKTYANIPRAAKEIISGGTFIDEYLDHGGEQNTYFDTEKKEFATEDGKVKKVAKFLPNSVSKLSKGFEMIPRLAEYIASRKNGESIEVAMLDAARVTTNFNAGGDLVKFLNANFVPFLNPSVQGAAQHVRNIREAHANSAKENYFKGYLQLAGKFAVSTLPVVLLNALVWGDDEDYEDLSDYVKDNYYIIGKYGDGKFVRLPKGRTAAVIQNAVQQVVDAATGDDAVDFNRFYELFMSNIAPNSVVDNNILSTFKQLKNNETWYGDDLVPTRLQDVPAAEQYDESIDVFSKWLGGVTNTSPYKINYLIDQYSGGIGDVALPFLTPEAERGGGVGGKLIAPLSDLFTTDSTMKNQNVSDFYSKSDELTASANSMYATDDDILKSKYMNSVSAEMSELYKRKREIQNSGLSDNAKYKKVREIQNQIDELAEKGLNTYGDISYSDMSAHGVDLGEYAAIGEKYFKRNEKTGAWEKLDDDAQAKYLATKDAGDSYYATDGTNQYRWYEPGEDSTKSAGWQKISADELERQSEVTRGLGISESEYWSNREEYNYAYDYPENYQIARAVGGYETYKMYSGELYDIKADKDENGKSISGSRKDKVIDYINGLDADYGEKIILFKNEYNADDTYNQDIVDYLNEREDISYEEMETILKELGFEVDSEGNIWW